MQGVSSPTDSFLDSCCLSYAGNDSVEAREPARERLAKDPGLARASAHVAAAAGAAEELGELVLRDPSAAVSPGGPRGWSPLLYLCYSRVLAPGADAVHAARLLLERGADPNARFELWGGSFTALTGVMGEGEAGPVCQPPHANARELAELLLTAGADPNDSQGLYNTMFRRDDGWLQLLLKRGLKAEHEIQWDMGVEPVPRTLDFLLSHAVDNGFAARVELLIEHGANPLGRNPYNGRHLHTNAVLQGRDGIARRLAEFGEPSELSSDERLRLACFGGDAATARTLWSEDAAMRANPSYLREAAGSGSLAAVETLLALGADPNGADASGVTALHEAAIHGHSAVVRALLKSGADPGRVDAKFGATAFGWAEHAGQATTAQLLRQ